jgi:hypothetical protein
MCRSYWPSAASRVDGAAAPDARAETLPVGGPNHCRHAFVQNVRRGHYDLATEAPPSLRLATAFSELAQTM